MPELCTPTKLLTHSSANRELQQFLAKNIHHVSTSKHFAPNFGLKINKKKTLETWLTEIRNITHCWWNTSVNLLSWILDLRVEPVHRSSPRHEPPLWTMWCISDAYWTFCRYVTLILVGMQVGASCFASLVCLHSAQCRLQFVSYCYTTLRHPNELQQCRLIAEVIK